MRLKQEGKAGTNGLDYFDICGDDLKSQFGYIAKKADHWKMYLMLNSEKIYFKGTLAECIDKVEELTDRKF